MGNTKQHQQSDYSVRLKNGPSVPFKVITSLQTAATRSLGLPANDEVLTREVDFVRFPDGTVADLIRESSGDPAFVVFHDGKSTLHRTLQDGTLTFVPPKIHKSILEAVCLPNSIELGCTPRGLLKDIDEVLENYVDYDPPDRRLIAHVALSSWFTDLLHVAPYLWIVGPYGCGKTVLVRLLSVLCRRSILAADISSAGLYALSDGLHSTIILDDFEHTGDSRTRDLLRLLRNGSTAGLKVFRASRAYDVFGPKIIACRQAPSDAALKSRGLLICARPASRDLFDLTRHALAEVEHRLQPKLLGFRLENYMRLMHQRSTSLAASSLTPRIRDIFRALALPLMGDAELEQELLEILAPHDLEAIVERHSELEWFVMAAVLMRVHIRVLGRNMVTAKALTENVEKLLEEAGEPDRGLTPRRVGSALGSLGFRTEKLGSWGRGLEISEDLILAAHVKAKRLGICVGDLRPPGKKTGFTTYCRHCHEQGLLFDNNGKELPYIEGEEFVIVPQDTDPFEQQ